MNCKDSCVNQHGYIRQKRNKGAMPGAMSLVKHQHDDDGRTDKRIKDC